MRSSIVEALKVLETRKDTISHLILNKQFFVR